MTAALALDVSAEMTPPPPASLPRSTDGQLLAALPTAVGCAQRFVRFTLERWGLFGLISTTEAAAAELVGDAVSATGIAIEHPSYLDLYDKRLNLVDLRLHLTRTHVVIEVWDADPTPPRPQTSAPDQAWPRNFYLPPHGGKVVWVALEIASARLHEGTRRSALPRRAGFPRPVPPAPDQPVEAMADPAVLERVLEALRRFDTTKPSADGPTTHSTTGEED
jgi:hypothetical protein